MPIPIPVRPVKKKTIKQILVDMKIIDEKDYEQLLMEAQEKSFGFIHQLLVDKKLIDSDEILTILSKEWEFEKINMKDVELDPDIVKMLPESFERRYFVIPFAQKDKKLMVAMADPRNILIIDEIQLRTGYVILPYISMPMDIKNTLDKVYGEDKLSSIISTITAIKEPAEELQLLQQTERVDITEISVETPEVEKIVNAMILSACEQQASDIHIEPFEKRISVRYRIDGVLREAPFSPPLNFLSAIISRIKIMTSSMDITERRRPQDGRILLTVKERPIELRVNMIPTVFGESCVMRILDRTSISKDLSELGFLPDTIKKLMTSLDKPYGIILVTGPTGCGKTTTLYGALRYLNRGDRKILTIEDPVEYNLEGLIQLNVNPEIGLNFATALRAFLRQDPDIIMVGEIRDKETAIIAMEASLTGHLVLSTLHTNDAPTAITRLAEMGIEKFLISSAMESVLAQRLVRKLCDTCKKPTKIPNEYIDRLLGLGLNLPEITPHQAVGCKNCNGRGYKGRTGIYEYLIIDEEIREVILKEVSSVSISELARQKGMRTLFEDGLIKVARGITSYEEVLVRCR